MCTQAELTEAQGLLTSVNAAIRTIMAGGQSYSLDSGQTKQSVTRSTLGELRKMRDSLRGEIQQIQACLNNTRSIVVRPSF